MLTEFALKREQRFAINTTGELIAQPDSGCTVLTLDTERIVDILQTGNTLRYQGTDISQMPPGRHSTLIFVHCHSEFCLNTVHSSSAPVTACPWYPLLTPAGALLCWCKHAAAAYHALRCVKIDTSCQKHTRVYPISG